MSIVFEMNETSLVNKVLGALSTFKYFVNFVRQVFAKFLNFILKTWESKNYEYKFSEDFSCWKKL